MAPPMLGCVMLSVTRKKCYVAFPIDQGGGKRRGAGMGSIHSEMPRYKIRMMSATTSPSMNAPISSEGGGKRRSAIVITMEN
jgi:hypothetical protein